MIPATRATKRYTKQNAENSPSLLLTFWQGHLDARLAGWSLAILLLAGSAGYAQGLQSATVEVVPPQSDGPSPAEIAYSVLSALGADTSLEMANLGLSAEEHLTAGPNARKKSFTLIQLAAPSEITSYQSVNNIITVSPVDDFDAFCDAIDYARILEKNRSGRYVKISIKSQELTEENLVKRAQLMDREDLTDQLYKGKRSERFSDFSRESFGFGRSSSQDKLDYKTGEAVEVEIGSNWYQAIIVNHAEDLEYVVSLTDMKAVAEDLQDRRMKRAVTRLESLPIVAPSNFLRKSRRPPGNAAKARVWKDKSGRFEVKATFVSQTDDAVSIQKQDGSILKVPLAKLSQEDRDYLTVLSKQAPSSGPDSVNPVLVRELSVDRSRVRLIRLTNVNPSPPPAMGSIESGDFPAAAKTIAIENSQAAQGNFNVFTSMKTTAGGSKGIALWNAENHNREPQQLLAFDVAKSDTASLIRLMRSQHVFDIEPGRGLVIIGGKRDVFISAKQLSVSRVEGNKITPILEWYPYRDAKINGETLHNIEVEAAWFLSGTQVLTKSSVGRLWTIWRLTKRKAIAEVEFITNHVEFTKTCIRQDGKVAAILTRGKISLLDVSKGQVTRQIPVYGPMYDKLQFSEDGQKLAAARRGELRTWDLSNGEIDRELWHPAVSNIKRIDWIDDNLLVNGKSLFDMRHSVLLWEYRGGSYGATYDTGKWWSIHDRHGSGPSRISAISIPHKEALQFMDRLENDGSLMVARSGDKIGLKVNVPDSHADQAEVISIASDRLRVAGYELVEDSTLPLMLVVTAMPQQIEEVEVYEHGEWHLFGKKPSIRNFTPHLWTCELQLDGETIWRQQVTWGVGTVIQMRPNDTPDAAVARAQPAEVSRVIPTRIPNKVARPGTATKNGAYGFSRITAQGLLAESL